MVKFQAFCPDKAVMGSRLFNSHGFGLMDAMVAIGILTIVMSGLTTVIINTNRAINDATKRSAENIFLNSISTTFTDKDACQIAITTAASHDLPANLAQPFKIQLTIPGYGLVKEGTVIENNFKLEEFYMDSFTAPINSGTANLSKVAGSMWVQAVNVGNEPSLKRRKRQVGVFTLFFDQTTREIKSCFGSSSMQAFDLCQQLGFIWDTAAGRCKQPLSASCADLGGTVQNNVCVPPNSVACTSLGGTWDGVKCKIPYLGNQSCPSGEVISGFDFSGNTNWVA